MLRLQLAYIPALNIESSTVSDTSCPAELIYDLIDMQFLCGRCAKLAMIQYLLPAES